MRSFFVRDKAFYRSFLALSGALMLEQAVVLCVNLADNVMIGSYSEVSLSGVAAVNQIQFFIQQIAFAISNALIVLAGQYWGQKRCAPIRQLTAIGVRLELVFSLVMFALTSLFPEGCVRLFVDHDAIVSEGVRYLDILRFSYPFFAVTTVLLGAMRSVENVQLALRVSVVSLVVNCCINYLLIGGRLGAPELGVRGAAIGTLTARVLEFFIVAWYVLAHDKRLALRLRDLLRRGGALARDFGKVALPIVVQGAMWGASNCLQTAILGHMNDNAVAAYSISSTIFLLLKVAAVGAATASSILIAKQIGAGAEQPAIRQSVHTMQAIYLGTGLVLAGILFAIRVPLLSLYKLSDTTRTLAEQFLLLQCAVVFTMSYQMPASMGILRGGGDTRFPVIVDLISIWVIVLPVSYLAAFVWKAPAIVVAICLNADQFFKCIPNALRVNRYHWIHRLTREA